jgi:hypothetical protein
MAKKLLSALAVGLLAVSLTGCVPRADIVVDVNGVAYDEAAFYTIKDQCSQYNVTSNTDNQTWAELIIIADTAEQLNEQIDAATTRESAKANLAERDFSKGALTDETCSDFVTDLLWAVTMLQKDVPAGDPNPYGELMQTQDIKINPRWGRYDPTQLEQTILPLTNGSMSIVGDRPFN